MLVNGAYTVRELASSQASVGGVMVSIVAFQAIDPGSIPGQRSFFLKMLSWYMHL